METKNILYTHFQIKKCWKANFMKKVSSMKNGCSNLTHVFVTVFVLALLISDFLVTVLILFFGMYTLFMAYEKVEEVLIFIQNMYKRFITSNPEMLNP